MENSENFNRPVLKEITENALTGGTLTVHQQQNLKSSANKSQQAIDELNVNENNKLNNTSENIDNNIILSKPPQENLKFTPQKIEEPIRIAELKSPGKSSSILPDILNVQPAIDVCQFSNDESLISSIASNFNSVLRLSETVENCSSTLAIPSSTIIEGETNGSNISSDDEIFADCQSFTPTPSKATTTNEDGGISTTFTENIRPNELNTTTHWDDFVTSVTSTNDESLENTAEHIDTNLDSSPPHEMIVADSTISSIDLQNNVALSDGLEEKCEEKENAERNLHETCEKESEKKVEIPNLENSSANIVQDRTDEEIHQKPNTTMNTLLNTNELSGFNSELIKKAENQLNELQNETTEVNVSEHISEVNTESGDICHQPLALEENLGQIFENIKETGECEEAAQLNETTEKTNSIQEIQTLDSGAAEPLLETNAENIQDNVEKNPPSVDIEELHHSLEMLSLTQNMNQTTTISTSFEKPQSSLAGSTRNLNDTFATSSEALNSAMNNVFDKTYDNNSASLHLNETRAASEPSAMNLTIEYGTNTNVSSAPTSLNNSFEPMDVDAPSPSATPSPFKNYTSNEISSPQENNDPQSFFAFKTPMLPTSQQQESSRIGGFDCQEPTDEDFQSNGLILNSADFDFLLTKGNNNVEVNRSSLLLRFDPLLGHSVAVNQQAQKQGLNIVGNSVITAAQGRLSPAVEEEETAQDSPVSKSTDDKLLNFSLVKKESISPSTTTVVREVPSNNIIQITTSSKKKNDKMSLEVIQQDMKLENDIKSIDNLNSHSDEKQNNFKMDDMEKKIKNEVLKTEDIEKKLKDAEQKEESLLKRITEKDKTMAKMSGVIEAYEKAIAESVAEKEETAQNYEKQIAEIKSDRDSNYYHLTSLETTFSDLNVKYEKSKEMTSQLKASEEELLAEKRQSSENLRLQEQRYEKMKNHAMQQLEIANKKLESLTKIHTCEITKLKALLKKEEISRASLTEQLLQKTRENEELMKICDELINGQGS